MSQSDNRYRAVLEVPTKATLVVQPEVGEAWEATREDIGRFGLIERRAFSRYRLELQDRLGIDLSDYDTDAPEGFADTWKAVAMALALVESGAVYDIPLTHPESEADLNTLRVLLGLPLMVEGPI